MNFAIICSTRQPSFLSETRGALGNALQYGEYIKSKAIESLSSEEALLVLKTAADKARAFALQTIRKFYTDDAELEAARIQEWCGTEAKTFIQTFIDHHDRDHNKFIQDLKNNKQ